MKRVVLLMSVVAMMSVMLTGCPLSPDGGDTNPTNTNVVDNSVVKGSLLVIDEANEILYAVGKSDMSKSVVCDLGSAPNNILVEGVYAYVVNSTTASITRVCLTNTNMVDNTPMPIGSNPYAIVSGDTYFYITLSASNMVARVNKDTLAVESCVDLNPAVYPEWIADDADNLYVATCGGYSDNYEHNAIVKIAKSSFSVVTNIDTWTNNQGVAIDADGNLYAACSGVYNASWELENGKLQKLTGSDYTVSEVDATVFASRLFFECGKLFACTGDGVSIYSNDTKLADIAIGGGVKGIAFDGSKAYMSGNYGATNMYIVDLSDNSVVTNSGIAGGDISLY